MADNTLNITPPFKFEIKTPPRGMTDYDPSAINPHQQEELNAYKINLMRENIAFLARNPEVRAVFAWSAEYFWNLRPRDIFKVVGKRFSLPEPVLRQDIKRVIREEIFHIDDELVESEDEEWDY